MEFVYQILTLAAVSGINAGTPKSKTIYQHFQSHFSQIEESGEGFDPPTEIRTIFVPIENAINIPDSFDINLGTSFGYKR